MEPIYLMLVCSVAIGVAKNIISKKGRDAFDGIPALIRTNLATAIAGLVIFGLFGVSGRYFRDPVFVFLAVLCGLGIMFSQIFYLIAVKNGPVSVCSLVYACGFLIPTIFAAACYREAMTLWGIMGILLLLLSICGVTGGLEKAEGFRWILPLVCSMACSGGVGILQKIEAKEYTAESFSGFLFLAFAVIFGVSLAAAGGCWIRGCGQSLWPGGKRAVLMPVVFGLLLVMNNKLNLELTGELKGIIFFPCYNGGVIAMSALFSTLLLKEKLSWVQWCGIGGSVAAIILIAL